MNEDAADYSFNKSHAACYGLIAYRTAWLKANYPAEYMAALISSVMSTKDKVPFFVVQCEAMGIKVLPPDVNESGHRFNVVEGNIRFGLEAVKGVGGAAVDAIIAAREKDGPFDSIWDFCERVDNRSVNKKAIESLIKCGAFGSTGATRKGMLIGARAAQAAGVKQQNDERMGQGSIFDMADVAAATEHEVARPPIPTDEWEQPEMLAAEKETLGLFLSNHPLEGRGGRAARPGRLHDRRPLTTRQDGDWLTVGGMIVESKTIRTKNGSQMMFAQARRPHRAGRDHRLRQDPRRRQGAPRQRHGRHRPRPDRPQGRRRDQARRPGGRALRADRGGARRSRRQPFRH